MMCFQRFFRLNILLAMLCALLLLPCFAAGEGAAENPAVPVKSIAINEKQVVLLVGAAEGLASARLTCTVTPEDASWQDVIWASSNEEIATVSPDGTVLGVAPGKVKITAVSTQPDSKAKAEVQVTVQQAVTGIDLDSESLRIPVKKSMKIRAEVSPENAANRKVVWSSSDENIAKVSEQGAVQGVAAGDAVITAVSMDGSEVSASCRVTVYVPVGRITLSEGQSFVLPAGLNHTVTAAVSPEDATDPGLIWTSSDETIATVDENGNVTGIAFGKAKITAAAADGSGVSATTTVVVNQAVEHIALRYEELYVPAGKNVVIKAEVTPENAGNKKLEWISSDEAVVTITKDGKVSGVQPGEALITARAADGSGIEAVCRVTVGEEPYDEPYREGLEYMADERYYSARGAFSTSHMADAEDMAEKCVQNLPKTAELWHNQEMKSNEMRLLFRVEAAEPSTGRYFMVYTEEGELASTLFIRGSGAARTNLPGGRYRIRDAWGTEWYGTKETFGREGSYEYMVFNEFEEDEYLTDLAEGYEWTISINVSESAANAADVGGDDTDWESWAGGTP